MESYKLIQQVKPDITEAALEEFRRILDTPVVKSSVARRKRKALADRLFTALLAVAVLCSCLLLFAHQIKLLAEEQRAEATGFFD